MKDKNLEDKFELDDIREISEELINDESLKELLESIRLNGLLNPIIVRKKNDGRYEIISGHRRNI